MINENYGNVIFGLASISMLLGSIKHSEYISDNVELSEQYYFSFNIGIVITCLFANICLGIFALFILGNLCDFIQKMTVNLIGARQKLRVLAVLIFISFVFYSGSNTVCFMKSFVLSAVERKMAINSLIVSILQLVNMVAIHMVHPDVFGLKWIKEVREYDRNEKLKVTYL
ncbi:uncharacterized protein VICG_01970 [Vittaforma corneae ATCC 50505]|uniref:Uncharacterized protein n=1 Tax=Vittaforma corneae (strain ATCC 50505) TaxID=993615 RepID=L2GJH3_VITCO|nr:uncharacterized protein VICG_01970 [Vittaforma corneae ATCC 50505]ELA41011.1 hypothetical protein VICG_01970 [Vittaforma corneae ATCC 50505]